MIRLLLLLAFIALPVPTLAQETPVVTVELQENETVVGQPLVVRIKVLVPTFSPKPPEFPSLEAPGLIVRLPERASGPISEQVNGETWSGVQRAYRVYPLQPGAFEIPAQTVGVTYAEPGGIEPITVNIDTEVIRFQALIPSGAEGLSPLIIADDFQLSQTLETPEEIAVGDAIERTVIASISGTTPVLIPELIAPVEIAGMRSYPKEPKVSETEERGVLSGERQEAATYLATSSGQVTLPPIEYGWFNLQTNSVESVRVEGVTVSITGEGPAPSDTDINWARWVGLFGLIAAAGWLILKTKPQWKAALAALRQKWETSEIFAFRRLKEATSRRDLSATYHALRSWSQHFPEASMETLHQALVGVGATDYGKNSQQDSSEAWRIFLQTLKAVRRDCLSRRRKTKDRAALPPMNAVGR